MAHRNPHIKAWIHKLNGVAPYKSLQHKFRDFCELSYTSYARLTTGDAEIAENLEERYMRVVRSYKHKDDIRKMPGLWADAFKALEWGGIDFLGEVAAEIGVLDARQGQYFTPYNVSVMMARLMIGDLQDLKASGRGYVTMNEPCVGSGSLVLAMADAVMWQRRDIPTTLLVSAADLNPLACKMAYIQFTMRGIPAYVAHRDSLAMNEPWDRAWTPPALLFLQHYGHLFKRHDEHDGMTDKAVIAALLEQLLDIIQQAPQQMTFFDWMNQD